MPRVRERERERERERKKTCSKLHGKQKKPGSNVHTLRYIYVKGGSKNFIEQILLLGDTREYVYLLCTIIMFFIALFVDHGRSAFIQS